MTRIAVIGGGSYQWSPKIISDLLSTPSLRDATLVLEDVNPEPLPKMERYAHLVAEAVGATPTVTTTTDQREALAGADFVIVTISTGGFRSMAQDIGVPERYGIRQSVGDSVGPGGISRALRNIPVLVAIARDMEALCPDGWMINITNPMTTLTRAVAKATSIKVVGLCHEVGHFLDEAAPVLGVERDALRPTMVGVNHFPVMTALDIDGRDGLALLAEVDDEKFRAAHQIKFGLLERFGALPAAGDRHLAEFLPGFLTEESEWGTSWGTYLTTIEMRELMQDWFVGCVDKSLSGEMALDLSPSGEIIAPVIDSLVTGRPCEVPVNIPNRGQAPDLPQEVVVESICVVDGNGIRGRDDVVAPPFFAELIRRHAAAQELTVEAALTGDRSLVRQAMLLDPLAGRGDLRATERMTEELLDATAEWLPQFS